MKKLLVLLTACILVSLLTACIEKTDTASIAIVSSTEASLTTVAVNENQVLYFVNNEAGMIRIRSDGTSKEWLIEEMIYNVIIKNGWIYFCLKDEYGIYKMQEDSTEKIKISDDRISSFVVQGEWIYFNSKDDWGLYKIRTDGTDKKRLGNKQVNDFCVLDNSIYFTEGGPEETKRPLFSINTNGNNLQDLHEPIAFTLKAGNGHLVYSRIINQVVYTVNLNTKTMKSKIIDSNGKVEINTNNNCYVYVDLNNRDLHIADMDGTNDKTIVSEDKNITWLMTANDKIYYTVDNWNDDKDGIDYSINLDGTGKMQLPQISYDWYPVVGSNGE